jgi:hypothetical protein
MTGSPPDWKPTGDGRTETHTQWRGRKSATRRIRALDAGRAPLDDLPAPLKGIAARWAKGASVERRIETLMDGIALGDRVLAEQTLDLLLERGWIEVVERYAESRWRRAAVTILDLAALREALGLSNEAALWREAAVRAFGAGERAAAVGRHLPLNVPGLDYDGVLARLAHLTQLSEGPGPYLRSVSATLFGGRSKVLDGREALVCAILGTTLCPFPEVPLRLDIVVPPAWDGEVLFIENPLSFEAAWRTPYRDCELMALVLAQGFKASARRVRERRTTSVFARLPVEQDAADRFARWLFREDGIQRRVSFWGDLDYSGMNILKELRAVFPGMRAWAPGYAPMLDAINAGNGHPPEEAEKENQADPGSTGCQYADETLLPAMRETGMFYDQEGAAPIAPTESR